MAFKKKGDSNANPEREVKNALDSLLDLSDLDTNVEEDLFPDYDGPIPPRNLRMTGYVKVWLTTADTGTRLLKTLFVARSDNPELSKYNGCPIWDDVPLTNAAKFRWHAFMSSLGATPTDLVTKTTYGDESNIGYPILAIGSISVNDSLCAIRTRREEFEGATTTKVAKWLPNSNPNSGFTSTPPKTTAFKSSPDDDIPF